LLINMNRKVLTFQNHSAGWTLSTACLGLGKGISEQTMDKDDGEAEQWPCQRCQVGTRPAPWHEAMCSWRKEIPWSPHKDSRWGPSELRGGEAGRLARRWEAGHIACSKPKCSHTWLPGWLQSHTDPALPGISQHFPSSTKSLTIG
jgi:hypothetical protein